MTAATSTAASRIVVTGAAGRLGRRVVEDLLQRGYEVLAVDRIATRDLPCRSFTVDLNDAASVYDVLNGADAVIHLGAVPGPQSEPASVTFHNNVTSTFNVVEAAAILKLQKLVFASSVFTIGWAEDADTYWPRYVPVDEQHPLTPFEAYGLSKVVGEEICAAASRRSGLVTVSLRIMNVIQPEQCAHLPWPAPTAEQKVRFVLWPYVEVGDAARSCRMALEASTQGHEAFFIAADNIRFDCPTRQLLQTFGPRDLEYRTPLEGTASVISIEKARRMLGFEPQFRWKR